MGAFSGQPSAGRSSPFLFFVSISMVLELSTSSRNENHKDLIYAHRGLRRGGDVEEQVHMPLERDGRRVSILQGLALGRAPVRTAIISSFNPMHMSYLLTFRPRCFFPLKPDRPQSSHEV